MNLPVIVKPLPDESFKSWVHRLSAPYLVPPVILLQRSIDQKADAGSMKYSELISHFSSISKISLNDLHKQFREDVFASQYLSNTKSKPNLWYTKLPKKNCHICWDEDARYERPKYLRRQWLEPWRIACSKHGVYLRDHIFSPNENNVFYSSNKKIFSLRSNVSNSNACTSDEKWAQQFSRAYDDLYHADINRLAITSEVNSHPTYSFNNVHRNIEALLSAVEVALVNQKPVFYTNLLNWLVSLSDEELYNVFPIMERGASRSLCDDLAVSNKIFAIEYLLPLFLSAKHLNSFVALMTGAKSPIRNQLATYKDRVDLKSPIAVLSLAIRKDMWADIPSFMKTRQNVFATAFERQYTALETL